MRVSETPPCPHTLGRGSRFGERQAFVGNPTDGRTLCSRPGTGRQGGAPMSTIAAAAGIADRIDYWIRQHVIPYCQETYPRPSQNKWNPARHRRDGLTAIGQCLKDQYDALATPVPPHLAALVKQLETEEQG